MRIAFALTILVLAGCKPDPSKWTPETREANISACKTRVVWKYDFKGDALQKHCECVVNRLVSEKYPANWDATPPASDDAKVGREMRIDQFHRRCAEEGR